jgi:hypothetical protein
LKTPRQWSGSVWTIVGTNTTDDVGRFALPDLPAGHHRVRFVDPAGTLARQYFAHTGLPDEATTIMLLSDSTVSNVDATLNMAGKIAGRVTDAADASPLPHIQVVAETWDRTRWISLAEGETDGAGEFLLAGLPAGRHWTLRFRDTNGVYASEWYDGAIVREDAAAIMTRAGALLDGRNVSLERAGAIRGNVTAADGGSPLPGVWAIAHRWNGWAWEEVESGETDAGGNYTIRGLAAGEHRVLIKDRAGDHASQWYTNAVFVNGGVSIAVTPPGTASNIDVSLGAGTRITGRVADNGASPLSEIGVTAYLHNGADWEAVHTVLSDPYGAYALGGLPAGQYLIFFEDASQRYFPEWFDGVAAQDEALVVTAVAGSVASNKNAVLGLSGRIAGTITGPGGGPLQGIHATACTWDGVDATSVSSDMTVADGSYEIRGLPAGTYRIEFADYLGGEYVTEWFSNATDVALADDVTVGDGEIVAGIDAALDEVPATGIAGTVTGPDAIAPLATVQVSAYAWDGSNAVWAASGSTSSNGAYYIHPLAPGTYRVEFYDYTGAHITQWYSNAPSAATATDLPIGDGEVVSNINASLAVVPLTGIAGTVTEDDGTTPIASVLVSAYAWNGSHWVVAGSDVSASNGAYCIQPLDADTYRVRFFAYSGSHVTEWFSNATDVASATDIAVTEGGVVTNVNAAMAATPSGAITGAVTGPDGMAALGGIDVYAYDWDGTNWISAGWGVTASNGAYTIDGLRANTYRILFNDASMTFFSEWYSNAADRASAQDIGVGHGETVSNVNAALDWIPVANAAIVGVVTAAETANPLAGIAVYACAWDGAAWTPAGVGASDEAGGYRISGLFPDTYRVEFYDPSNRHRSAWFSNATDAASATDIPVGHAQTVSNVNAALAPVPVTGISGLVTGAEAGPLPGVEVMAHVWDGASWTQAGVSVTSSNGTYLIAGLPVNTYRVRFRDGLGKYLAQWFSNAVDVVTAANVPVAENEVTAGIDAVLLAREPIPPVVVGLESAPGDEWIVRFTGESGFSYGLQSSTWLTNDWTDTGASTNGLDGTNTLRWMDSSERAFLRVRAQP